VLSSPAEWAAGFDVEAISARENMTVRPDRDIAIFRSPGTPENDEL
jgi:hypothetical protein